jgi:hypothetical protein
MIEPPNRLTPEMSSRKVQVEHAVRFYFLQHGVSPTLGEIGAMCGISRQRAHAIVGELALDGRVRRVKGQSRGIMLLDPAKGVCEADALLQLQGMGWKIDLTAKALAGPLTNTRLPLAPVLDHVRDIGRGDEQNDGGGQRASGAP